jgi:hypothetical protein
MFSQVNARYILYYRVMQPSQVIIYQYDSYQLDNNLGAKPANWTLEMCRFLVHFVLKVFLPSSNLPPLTIRKNPQYMY